MRLIDADAFASHLYGVVENYRKDFEDSFAALVIEESIIYDLDYAPTIDAVPVVRCRECKRWDKFVGEEHRGFCFAWKVDSCDEDYCSYGQRKENNHD